MNPVQLNDIERMQAELAEMARFPEMNPGPVCRLDLEGKILLANSSARKVFAGTKLIGSNWLELCNGLNEQVWQQILNCEGLFPFEAHINNSWILFNHVCTDGQPYVFVFGTDITAQKIAESRLAEQASLLAEVARFPDMNPGPVVRMNLEGMILLSNAAAKNLFGEDLKDQNWLDIWPELKKDKWQEIIQAREVVPVEVHIADKDFVFNHRRDHQSELVFVFGTDITLQKKTEQSLRQSEKMATLGTLAAGVAHELNNPAAATRRAAQQLRTLLDKLEKARENLYRVEMPPAETGFMLSLAKNAGEISARKQTLSSLQTADTETELEEWLEELGIDNAWELAPVLVQMEFDKTQLVVRTSGLKKEAVIVILQWITVLFPIYVLLNEIYEGSSRISEIVVALKNYSFLGQSPVQAVNIHEGLDNTLVILRSKLKEGITVNREYASGLPKIMAYGSELNQVWTNLLDNAVDAMKGKGEIHIRTRMEKNMAIVEIEDNGPGIPAAIQSRIFDPFFTTKEPGKGTGLGLSTSYGIITEKHKGSISVRSKPGSTTFIVKLPVSNPVPATSTH